MALVLNGQANTIGGLAAGGLPDDSVTTADVNFSPGKILQVVQTLKTDTVSHTGTGEADITGMTCNITPASTSNKILVLLTVTASWRCPTYIKLYRDSTKIGAGDAVTGKIDALFGGYQGSSTDGPFYYGMHAHSHSVLDSPSSTSELTYKLTWDSGTGNCGKYLNLGYNNASHLGRGSSQITLMEVAG